MPEVVTLSDAVNSLIDRSMGDEGNRRTVRLMTTAVQQTMRDITKKGKWRHYTGMFRFRTSPQVSPAITYVESTRLMTITDAKVWPADAIYGEIVVNSTPYSVQERVSDTVIKLDAEGTLGANYTGTVQWQRQRYNFTKQFSKIHYLMNLDNRLPMSYMDVARFYEQQRLVRFAGIPSLFTMRNSSTSGMTDIVLAPASETSFLIEGNVSYIPDIPKIYQIKASDGNAASASTTFTSAGANFPTNAEGAVLRIYETDSDIPYGVPIFESFIKSRDSATQLTLATPANQAYANVLYVISSHIDIDPILMLTMFDDFSYENYCQNHDHKGLAQAQVLARKSLMEALAAETKNNHSTMREFAWNLAMAGPSEYAQFSGNIA